MQVLKETAQRDKEVLEQALRDTRNDCESQLKVCT